MDVNIDATDKENYPLHQNEMEVMTMRAKREQLTQKEEHRINVLVRKATRKEA